MPNRKQIAEDVLDARRTKRQVEIVEQFESRVYENMADQVYFNIKTVVDLLIDHNKEEDLVELARAFAVDDVDIKCADLEELRESIIINAESYIFKVLDWEYDKEGATYLPIGFEPPRGRTPKAFRVMHSTYDIDEFYATLDSGKEPGEDDE